VLFRSTVPIGSTCFNGLSVSRPSRAAVGSPNRRAINPCATSWKTMAITSGTSQVAIFEINSNVRGGCGPGGDGRPVFGGKVVSGRGGRGSRGPPRVTVRLVSHRRIDQRQPESTFICIANSTMTTMCRFSIPMKSGRIEPVSDAIPHVASALELTPMRSDYASL